VPLPLVLTSHEHIPIYMQLVHQFRHLITSRQIGADNQLPSVRELAQQLGVNSGTVALAYRTLRYEGLIESRRGRGTYVASVPDEASRFGHRQELLNASMDDFLGRAYALGFDAPAIRQNLATRLQLRHRQMPIVVVMPSVRTSEKYAALIAQALPRGIRASWTSVSIGQLEKGAAILAEAYQHAFFTFTFMSLAPRVDALLRRRSWHSEVFGMTAQVTEDTKLRLRELDPAGSYCMVGESRNLSSALNLVAQYSAIDVRRLPTLTELSSKEQFDAARPSLYIYSFGVTELLDELGVPAEQRLQLEFTLSDESRVRLRSLLDLHPPQPVGVLEPVAEAAFG